MKDLCVRSGSKCAYLPSSVNWYNSRVPAVFDGSLFPHSDEIKFV